MHKSIKPLLAAALIGTMATTALGQDQRPERPQRPDRASQRAEQLTPEDFKTAWTWQAKEVAQSLKLDDETSKTLTETYLESRESLAALLKEHRENQRAQRGQRGGQNAPDADAPQGDRPARGNRGARGERGERGQGTQGGQRGQRGTGNQTPEFVGTAKDNFKTSVDEFLNDKQLETVMASLGAFDANWDRMTHAMIELELDDEKTSEALTSVRKFTVGIQKLRASGDRENMRAGHESLREELQTKLAEILNEEQLQAYQEKVTPRRRQQRDIRDIDFAPAPAA